jgi:glycosyltransferase involved in cell wall biosynthesis
MQVPGFLAAEIRATRRLIAEERADVVNAHWLVPQALTAAVAVGRRGEPPMVAHAHGGDAHVLRRLRLGKAVAEFILRRTRVLLASGSGVRQTLNELTGRDVGAHVQPMGVDLGLFRDADGSLHPRPDRALEDRYPGGFLVFVGRLIEIKGGIHLIRALPIVRKAHPELGLVMIGDGPERECLEREVALLGLDAAVLFAGRLPHHVVAGYIRGCRAAAVPSVVDSTNRSEGMPTVILEAMAAGARVIATATGGIPDVVRHGENGWLCQPANPTDLAEKILAALDEKEPSRIVRAARQTADGASWNAVADAYMGHLEAAVGGGR